MTLVEPKDNLFCPLTLQLFTEPVFAKDGHTYEKQAIEKWFQSHQTSPITRQEISTELIPNYDKKNQIDRFRQKHKICTVNEFLITIDNLNLKEFKQLKIISPYLHAIKFDDYPSLRTATEPEIIEIKNQHNSITTALCIAADSCDSDMCQELLKLGANVNETNGFFWTPLHFASVNGYTEIVELLLQHKANVNSLCVGNFTPLTLMLSNFSQRSHLIKKRSEIAIKLIQSCEDVTIPTDDMNTALHFAARETNIEIVDLLLKKFANVNVQNKNKSTPLHFSIALGDKEIFLRLLSAGADPNITDDKGRTALHLSVIEQRLEFIDKLLTLSGVCANAKDENGNTSIHLLFTQPSKKSITTQTKILNKLLKFNADPNCQNDDGDTPLHLYVKNHTEQILVPDSLIHSLIFSGADVNLKNKSDVSVFDLLLGVQKSQFETMIYQYKCMSLGAPKLIQDLQLQIHVLNSQVNTLLKVVENLSKNQKT
jgi:ankyrin repeat protein